MRRSVEVLGAALALVGIALGARFFVGNVSTVIPGQVYRSRQLEAADLEAEARRLSLRAIVNLRGGREGERWYREEQEVARRLGPLTSTCASPRRACPRASACASWSRRSSRRRARCCSTARRSRPQRARRPGLAVLVAGGDLAAARHELGPIEGLLSRSVLPRVLDQYEGWLLAQRERPSPAALRRFAADGYTPAFYDARIALQGAPPAIAVGESARLRVRVSNQSPEPWQLTSGGDAGVHLALRIRALDPGREFQRELRAPTPDRRLAPHEAVELEAVLPPLPEPGAYEVWLDLVDEAQAFFSDMGSEPARDPRRRDRAAAPEDPSP